MTMLTRFIRIWKADIHGVMDQLEDKPLVLKQSLRDMEEELARKEARLGRMNATKAQYIEDQRHLAEEIEKLEQDLKIAIEKDKDDIARMLIKKLKPIEEHHQSLARKIDNIQREIEGLAEILETQRDQYRKFHLRATDYLSQTETKKWDDTMTSVFPGAAGLDLSDEEIELELIRRKERIHSKGGSNESAS